MQTLPIHIELCINFPNKDVWRIGFSISRLQKVKKNCLLAVFLVLIQLVKEINSSQTPIQIMSKLKNDSARNERLLID